MIHNLCDTQPQKDVLGRDVLGAKQFMKFPSSLFRDFVPNGSLCVMLNVILTRAREHKWVDMDLLDPLKRDVMMLALGEIETKLVERGLLSWPKIVFHHGVPPRKIEEMKKIVQSHRGTVVDTVVEATHIIEWDKELDSNDSLMGDEEYIRTVQVRTGIGASEALVHWWYYPDSYDEWIPISDIDCSDPPDVNVVGYKGARKWRVCCRFITDVCKFNEWV